MAPSTPADAWHLFDLWTHATPPAIARIEGYGAADWEPVGHEGVVPRSSLNPLLHFSDVRGWLLPDGQRVAGFAQHGACRDGPHYLRFLVRDGDRRRRLPVRRAGGGRRRRARQRGSCLRCEHTSRRGALAAEATGFEPVGEVTHARARGARRAPPAGDGAGALADQTERQRDR